MRPRRAAAGLVLALWIACVRPGAPPQTRVVPPPSTSPPAESVPPVHPEISEEEPPPVPSEQAALAEALGPILLKVGLATDLDTVSFPCCEEGLAAQIDRNEVPVTVALKVEPAAAGAEQGYYRIQVAALRDERQAHGLARQLTAATGLAGGAYFDAGIDLYRVRVGHFATREKAEDELRRLATVGVIGAFVVNEGGGVSAPALRLIQGGAAAVHPGRWLSVSPAGGDSVRVNGKRYRGRILVYLNDRGTLNLINEVPVEEYLRGVVPSEMGPEQYNQLEALKAQAVAARTYTLRNLGEFLREGYDICGTPRCQVYNGMAVEHPLSDRAIAETAGQVLLYEGRLADTLYSSTCGGHTENVKVVFPFKEEPYLKAVPCMEVGLARLEGDLPPGQSFPEALVLRLLPPAPGVSGPAALGARLEHLALLGGLPAPRESLTSLDRREVQRYVAYAFDLVLDARLLTAPADVDYLLHDPPRDWGPEDLRRAAYLIRSGLVTGPLDLPLSEGEIERMLLALAELLRVVRREEVSFMALDGTALAVRSGKEDKIYPRPGKVATFRRRGEILTSAPLALLPGDRLTLFWLGDRIVSITQDVDLDGAAFDRSSPYSSWTRFRTDSQLAAQVRTRFPSLVFTDFEVLERGASGRVGRIRVHGAGDEVVEVDGLAIRWTLDVPDTLFTVKRLTPKGREAGYLFTGRGFGHGVGMCQVGSYGMAQRGHSYRDILSHYYTGAELGRVRVKEQPSSSGVGRGRR